MSQPAFKARQHVRVAPGIDRGRPHGKGKVVSYIGVGPAGRHLYRVRLYDSNQVVVVNEERLEQW